MADTGISNRETAREEADERRDIRPSIPNSPPPEDAAGRVGEEPLDDHRDRHTSNKAGSRSIAQKESEGALSGRFLASRQKGGRSVRQRAEGIVKGTRVKAFPPSGLSPFYSALSSTAVTSMGTSIGPGRPATTKRSHPPTGARYRSRNKPLSVARVRAIGGSPSAR